MSLKDKVVEAWNVADDTEGVILEEFVKEKMLEFEQWLDEAQTVDLTYPQIINKFREVMGEWKE